MVDSAPLWSVLLLPLVLGAMALAGASIDSALGARAAGRPVSAVELAGPLRESARLLVTQRRTTVAPDAVLWRLGAGGMVAVALLATVVTPLGTWSVQDLPVGVVWFNAMEVLLWPLVWMAGWGANSAYPLVGGYRFLAQALAYELPLMFALITPALAAGSLRVGAIVADQDGLWYVVWMPVAAAVYLLAVLGLSFWGPGSAPVGLDLAGGVRAELSGVDNLVFTAGRYMMLSAGAAFAVPLFLGGGAGPLLPAWLWSVVKALAVLAALVWLRRRVPLVRMDRFQEVAWLVVIPLILVQALVVGIVVLDR